MEFIVGEKPAGCVLCAKADESTDPENLVVHRGRTCYLLMNLYPYNPGHLMIVPYAHVSELAALDPATHLELMTLTTRSIEILRAVMAPAGFNLGMNLGQAAGAGIADHLHQHVVPRWNGDTNFLPILGQTRSLPEDLGTTYGKLRGEVDRRLAADPAFWETAGPAWSAGPTITGQA
jgi:ATP adenylyltransferase